MRYDQKDRLLGTRRVVVDCVCRAACQYLDGVVVHMIVKLLEKSIHHPITTLAILAFIGGCGLGIQFGLWNALIGGAFGVVLTLLLVFGEAESKYAYLR